ncbi:hypothetical protein H9W91_17480 [Streptomyces alfalfae]|uniref:hypothetical protein n=1 Tax=Streptomyces alfalfae TaxID=1642299 RepID=UPI001BA6BB46|nr:hypothetical protein [Streptomyces alfalfae]QUI32453.1 hypothetical protein H9W91_17480 [Streptomyces alfalfae]
MMRFLFGALLALLIVCPALLSVLVVIATQPAALAFAAGVIVWPRLARTVRGWTA